jgi:hypothetical protein
MAVKEFITAPEAIKLFIDAGLSESTFYRKVREGDIQKELPAGRQRGALYLRSTIENIVQREGATSAETKKRETHIGATDWVQSSDLPYLLALDYEMYGPENVVDISITRGWWEKNPYMCRILFDTKDRKHIWGAITILPMKEETIFRLLRQEMEERSITPDDILTYEAGNTYYGYIASAIIRPEYRAHFRELIQSIFDYWCEQYPEVKLQKLYAFALSDEGWDLVKHLFFSPRYDLSDTAFELNPNQRNPSRLITSFQRCLKHKEDSLTRKSKNRGKTATFNIATTEDAQGIYDVIASLWGTLYTTPVKTRLSWYQSNPDIDFVVKQDGEILGYVTIMPLKHDIIEKLMEGKIRGWDIKADDVLSYKPGKPVECYVGAAIKAGVQHQEKYGMRLLSGTMKELREFAKKGIAIKKLYAVSDTPDGEKLSSDLGFEESPPAPNSTFKQYTLDMETSNSSYAREYRKVLEQYVRNKKNIRSGDRKPVESRN